MKAWISQILVRIAARLCIRDYKHNYGFIGIDFDGVILPFKNGDYDRKMDGHPDETILAYARWLKQKGYTVIVFTSRCLFKGGYQLTKAWLDLWGFPYDQITGIKFPCSIFWDDHGRYYSISDPKPSGLLDKMKADTEASV